MALHFHPLTILSIEPQTANAVCITFHVPDDLKDIFAFKHGQNLTLKSTINGESVRRSYSICTSPFDNALRIGVKKIEGGIFSTFLNKHVKVGDVLEVMPPSGTFYTELDPGNKKLYMAFAAGSGITPILSIAKTILYCEPGSSVILVYGNRDQHSIMFSNELENLKNQFINRLAIHHVFSRQKSESGINYGRIDEKKCRELAALIKYNYVDDFFLCGPEEMTFTIKKYLQTTGVHKAKIHFELFHTTVKSFVKSIIQNIDKPQDDVADIQVKVDGRLLNFSLGFNHNSILDAALAEGADLPFACKGGVCCTCKAKLLKGEIAMDVNYGLEDEEVQQGFILTCQSHPRSKEVMVDFDVK